MFRLRTMRILKTCQKMLRRKPKTSPCMSLRLEQGHNLALVSEPCLKNSYADECFVDSTLQLETEKNKTRTRETTLRFPEINVDIIERENYVLSSESAHV